VQVFDGAAWLSFSDPRVRSKDKTMQFLLIHHRDDA